ncbi:hypothetical protein Dsin_027782 [Dipteronia sinensis]|uniref:non-specific serine/threonine protein kinase n=1 Tax=Dipteronia sinensis TaxID=43782 RepID=A0AAD9ZQT2_9ROSI|nr:hypothetical protein Dsin_027782 [Dipteronia sinensis]
MTWSGNLINIQKMSNGGADLYIRLAHSELAIKGKIKLLGLERVEANAEISSQMNQVKLQDLPLFNFGKLATTTNNSYLSNKLGQGGFRHVYKGILEDGLKIAVKRLSKASGQGMEEFMNEVVVISKLEHRNLVRLLGCCVEGEENMLIYEYMPSKSLDAFLFDRDLKASNILLDEELNPKISDFGMARIFGGNQHQANTAKVVGTYFEILQLEIVSGRRNTGFHHDEHCLTLLGYAWKLWNENNIVALIDSSTLYNPCFHMEIS